MGDGTFGSGEWQDGKALWRKMEAFKDEMRGTVEAVRGDVETLGKEHTRTTRLVERLFGYVEARGGGRNDARAPGGRRRRAAWTETKREYPELVTSVRLLSTTRKSMEPPGP